MRINKGTQYEDTLVKIPEEFKDAESYLRHLVYQGAKGNLAMMKALLVNTL